MRNVYTITGFLLMCITLYAQESRKVQGTVVDFTTGKPLPQVIVSAVYPEGISTEVSGDGRFEIKVPSLYTVLTVSYPGYQTKEFPLYGNDEVRIELLPEELEAGENTVRLPYHTTNQRNLNGAYTVISPGYDKTIRQKDIEQLLQGTVPGLDVRSFSGVPAEGSVIRMRGTRSLYMTNEPLIVIDGLPVVDPTFNESVVRGNVYNFLSDLNVKDIESVTVMRDASAAGIYGSRAANGAIVITTKEGTQGKTFFDVSVQQGLSFRFKEMPVMNASEYLPYLSEKIHQQGLTNDEVSRQFPFFTPQDQNTMSYRKYANNTNWQDLITRNAYYHDYFLGVRGGDATSKYALNVGYSDRKGVVRGIAANRLSARFNLDFKILSKLTAGIRIGFSRTNKDLADQGYEERVNPLYLSLVKPPILAPYVKSDTGVDGPFFSQPDYEQLSNPLAVSKKVKNEVLNTWVLGSVFARFAFNRSLHTQLTLSLDRRGLEEDRFTPADGIIPANNDIRFDRTSEEQLVNNQRMIMEHTLTFEKQWNPGHRLMAFGGYNFEFADYETSYGYTVHATSDDFQGLGDGLKIAMNGVDETYHNVSFFANADYSFREKYLFKTGVRMDGSSKFGNKAGGISFGKVPFALLPYAGVTWRVKTEPWMKRLAFIDDLDLRASWGITANQDIPVNARYSLYEKKFYTFRPGLVPYSLGNPEVKWETTGNFNAGLDFSFLRKKLNITLDYFHTKTTDLLLPKTVDGANGTSTYWANEGEIKNQGLELNVSTLGTSGDISWQAAFNIAKYRNKVSGLPGSQPVQDGIHGFTSVARNGEEAGLIYGYQNLGIFGTTEEAEAAGLMNSRGIPYVAGDTHFADLKVDGIINEEDRCVIGNPNPDFFGGITAGISYKNFDLDAVFTYSYGNDILNVLRMKLETGNGYENQSQAVLDRWQTQGDATGMPNVRYGDSAGNRLPSSAYMEDGSYMKLKSLTLSYSIRHNISFIRDMKLYLSGYNLFTLSPYSGWDPEVTNGESVFTKGYDFGQIPQSRMFMLGIKVGL
ncbi:SusC/RagA family TonB-linked outer membrane protein [Parabacteroides pacaensis]|uniref:SusC/RagA family TonB-linked outer membrane protein n=1 Tax=Parabacteroides pacaensis TaxID=2086575 RepID=UPI000D0FD3C1|nr:SusC/RagA family TonB-linked outer membrane protein [Parabacteroides pacaensis]